jgi:hypothetical protein
VINQQQQECKECTPCAFVSVPCACECMSWSLKTK